MRYRREVCSIDLVYHCNLACNHCEHASPHFDEAFATPEDIERDLAALALVGRFDRLMLSGGEPFLHPNVLEIARLSRRSGVAREIGMITNGVLLHKFTDDLWAELDVLQLSVYPNVKYHWTVSDVRAKADLHGVDLVVRNSPEFNVVWINDRIEDPKVVQLVYDSCELKGFCTTVRDGKVHKCAPANYFEQRLRLHGQEGATNPEDSFDLRGGQRRPSELKQYFASEKPLVACGYCLGSMGKRVPHHQLTRKMRDARMKEDHRNILPLLNTDVMLLAYQKATLTGTKGDLKKLVQVFLFRTQQRLSGAADRLRGALRKAWFSRRRPAVAGWIVRFTTLVGVWAALLAVVCLGLVAGKTGHVSPLDGTAFAWLAIIGSVPLWFPFILTRRWWPGWLLVVSSIAIACVGGWRL